MPNFMAQTAHIERIAYRPELARETLTMWRLAFQRAMGLPEQNDPQEVAGQLQFLQQIPPNTIQLAFDHRAQAVVGFFVQAGEEIEQLYVHPSHQGLGIGYEFVQLAKQRSSERVSLYTFAANTSAHAFYERQGFVEIARGQATAADNPWATDAAQLADIRYQWRATR